VDLDNFGEYINSENHESISSLIEENIESLSYKEIVRNNLYNVNSEVLKNIIKTVMKVMLKTEIINKKVRLVGIDSIESLKTPFVLKMSPDESELN